MAYDNLIVEPAHLSCAAIAHFLVREHDPVKHALMVADLSQKVLPLGRPGAEKYGADVLQSLGARDLTSIAATTRREVLTPGEPAHADVMIVSVTPTEAEAVLQAFETEDYDTRPSGRRYYPVSLTSAATGKRLTVVLTSIMRPYNPVAAAEVANMQMEYAADAYFLVGIAAGRRGRVSLGDVVVPESVYYYESVRSYPGEERMRPQHPDVERTLRRNCAYYNPSRTNFADRFATALSELPQELRPKVLPPDFTPAYHYDQVVIASGERLIQDGMLEKLAKEHNDDIRAGDEESFGFAVALEGKRWAIVRGISDYGQKRKAKDWQYIAAFAAALTLRDFLETQYEAPQHIRF